nr:unnamed protein product [Leishmania braziliensis]
MQACSLSQSMVDLLSAPQTPPRPATVTDVRECRLSALDTSQSNEGLPGANTGGEAVCTVIGTSLQSAWSSQLDVSATSGPLAHKAQQASAFPPPSPKYEPATLRTAKASPHPCQSSAGADGPLSAAALPQAAEAGATKPQPSTMPQCRSTCSCPSEGDSALEHRLPSTSSSLSVSAIVDSQAHAQEQSASRRNISGAFPETAAAAHLPTPSPSVRRASSTSAATTPSSVGAATSLSDSMRSIPNNMEAEVVVGTSTPMQPLSMRLPGPSSVAGSAVPTASEKSLSSHHSDSGSTLLERFAVFHDLQAFLQWEEEEKESHTCELPHDRDACNGVFERYHLSRAAAMTAAENEKFGALMCPTNASDHSRERTEDEESLESSVGGFLRGTDTTGHAPITPRLRSRIEKVQQQELEMLRTVPKERHPDIMDFLDSPDVLMRELEGMDAASNGQEDGNRDPTDDVADGVQAPHARLSPQKRPQPVLVSSRSSPTMSVARGSRVRPEGRPPVREVGRVAAPTTEKSGTTESVVRQYRRNGFAASSHSARARETNQAVPRASRRSNGSENGHVGSGDSVFISTPRRRLATEGGSRARFTPMLSCGALSDAIPPSPTTALNSQVTVAAVGVSASTQDPRQRPPVSNTPISSRSEQPLRTASRRGDGYSGSSSRAGTSPPHKAAAPASDDLLPALFSAQEAANTITIVFDLDETLCNNRCLIRPILRPGAELLLHTLRSLCPSPRYKLIDTTHTHTRNQNVSNRLYDEAMYRMGMMPSYYSRVAQRQSANGYHRTSSTLLPGTTETSGAAATDISDATASAGFRSTGEARPATAKDKSPLRLELVLWTASEESLARRAMHYMDPLHKIFDEAIYRDGRWYRDSYYTKELSRLGRSMDRVVIVENSIDSVIRNRNNAILVTSFVRNRLDRQLFLVREVLRDWIWAMKAKLAHQQDAARAASGQQESIEPSTARDLTLHAVSQDAGGACTEKCSDEGGESLVPPYSTPSAARIHRSESIPMQIGHIDTPIRSGDLIHVDPDGNVSLREVIAKRAASAPCCPAARAVSGSAVVQRATLRPLSAMARRASDIVEFLRHHRLILPDSNFLRFQLTAEVMKKLQTTEAALIAAALPPSPAAIEPADAQVVRTLGGVSGSRTTRGGSALPNVTPPSPATAANSAGLPSKMLRSGTVGRALPNGGVASVGGVTADAARLRTSMKEVGTATISTPPPAGSAARTTPDSHLDSPAPNSVACWSETHCDPVRLQRTVSVASKRLVTRET